MAVYKVTVELEDVSSDFDEGGEPWSDSVVLMAESDEDARAQAPAAALKKYPDRELTVYVTAVAQRL